MKKKQDYNKKAQDLQQCMILNGKTLDLVVEDGLRLHQLEQRRKQEEILWRIKSRIQWLKAGERKTKIFHESMLQ